jgi:cell division protein ZapB
MKSLNLGPEQDLQRLEEQVDALILLCHRLQEENHTLNVLMQEWATERASWTKQTTIAKNRVTAMITRLESMGHKT